MPRFRSAYAECKAKGVGQRIQGSPQVILAEMEDPRCDLHMLLQIERRQIAAAELEGAEEILSYMLRPSIEECLDLWFGKSEQTDQEVATLFSDDVALAMSGHYDHSALDLERPRLLVALVILLDQFPRNMYRGTPRMYAADARCLELVKRGLQSDVGARLHPIERVFLCLALTHSEALEDQLLCMEEWERVMAALAPGDPLNVFHEVFHRHVAVIKRFGRFPHRNTVLGRVGTPQEADFLADNTFRFDLPLVCRPDGSFTFAGTVKALAARWASGAVGRPDAVRARPRLG